MPQNSEIEYLVGSEEIANIMPNVSALIPFSEMSTHFLNEVSKSILNNPAARQYPDVITFAFWCRKAAILEKQKPYPNLQNRLGKGVIFHIAPSNVPVNFAFSLATGIIAGNANIVRVPSKEFVQVDIITQAIYSSLQMYPDMQSRICLVRYGHDKAVTDFFSSLCDVRVIWGGDSTIASIRNSPLPARATEVVFADRYSFSIINADYYLSCSNKEKIAQDFYNDTYLNDQNACTSPQLVMWCGTQIQRAKELFWQSLHDLLVKRYDLKPVQAVGKLSALCRLAIDTNASVELVEDNLIVRLNINQLDVILMDYKYHSGFFIEYDLKELRDIIPMCNRKCQTISYLGEEAEAIHTCISTYAPAGVDRIVPLGKTMEFALVWDGYDLIERMTRIISCI